MSDEGINKLKAMIKAKTEAVAEIAGQKLGEAAFEAKKVYDAASPLAKSTLIDLAQAAKAAKASFDVAMAEAEAKARAKASAVPDPVDPVSTAQKPPAP